MIISALVREETQKDYTVYDRGTFKKAKICLVCERSFTWRKKWERCWDEVTTCSKKCNIKRKQILREFRRMSKEPEGSSEEYEAAEKALMESFSDLSFEGKSLDSKEARKTKKKAMKAERRLVREGKQDESYGRKPCALCKKDSDLLIRCIIDSKQDWHMVCGSCWRLPVVAGGVIDGDVINPYYRYGGLWKNHYNRK